MGRPNVKAQRTEEILDAFETCVARYGVEGATLERIAEQAGLARALIRHHVGNRDELLDALVTRFLKKSDQESREFFDQLPAQNRSATMVEWLFDPAYDDSHLIQVVDALFIAANSHPKLAKRLRGWVKDFIAEIEQALRLEFDGVGAEKTGGGRNGHYRHLFQHGFTGAAGAGGGYSRRLKTGGAVTAGYSE